MFRIEGRKGTPASCTTPIEPGMVVRTQTESLARVRKGVLELYISDHPLDCLTCAANGDCELQDVAGRHDRLVFRTHGFSQRFKVVVVRGVVVIGLEERDDPWRGGVHESH